MLAQSVSLPESGLLAFRNSSAAPLQRTRLSRRSNGVGVDYSRPISDEKVLPRGSSGEPEKPWIRGLQLFQGQLKDVK